MSEQNEAAALRVRAAVVFCGARLGGNPAFQAAADALGTALAKAGIGVIYGGGSCGNMGVLADAALRAGGQVIGVIPRFLEEREIAHQSLSELILSESMHSRKARMIDLADAIVALPGGFGTLDELVEAITWRQLGLHDKPIIVCNVGGWADGILAAFDSAVANDFADPALGKLYLVVTDVGGVMAALLPA